MAYSPSYKIVITFLIFLLLLVFLTTSSAYNLCPDYYSETCPELPEIVKGVVQDAIKKEPRMGASLLRLHFHDCFVNGCDGSILLDDTPTMKGEKFATPNNNSVRGYEIIDQIKEEVEKVCPRVVSCADILAIAARDSVCALSGPTWEVLLGRRDGLTANRTAANNDLPSPLMNLKALLTKFHQVGLNEWDLIALSGAHTIGRARCTSFRGRLYNETNNLDRSKLNCPKVSGQGDGNLAPLDQTTPDAFNNDYYQNLVNNQGLLHSDQQLYINSATKFLVWKYIYDPEAFGYDFAKAMIKMGNIGVGNKGEIRGNCRKVNKK